MAIDPQFAHCAGSAGAAAGWDGEKDAHAGSNLEAAFRTVKTQMQAYIDQGLSPRDAALRAGKEAAEAARANGQVARRTQMLNLVKRTARTEDAIARVSALADRGSKTPVRDALHSMLDGSSTVTPVGNERASTAARGHAQSSGVQAGYEYDLRAAKLLSAARDAKGEFARNINRELYALSMRDSGEPSQVGSTGDANALKIAEIARKYQVQKRASLNAEGADIGDIAGYMGTTIHGADPIYKAGEQTWTRDMLAGLDPRTFGGLDESERAAFLHDLFGAFTTGRHIEGDGIGLGDPQFSGPGNLAKRVSQSRVLHWKDADAWINYQEKYSQGTFQEKMVNSLRNGARQHALLLDWGTSPKAEFENLMQRVLDHFQQEGQIDTVRGFTPTHRNSLMQLFGDLDGSNSVPLRAMGAKLATYARTLVSMADLGGVVFRHASAFATIPAELRYQGVPYLRALGSVLTNFLGPFQGEERKRVASLIGAGVENMHGAALGAGVGASDSLPGVGNRLLNGYVRLTGLAPALHAQKEGVALLLAHDLALDKGKAFADLSPGRRGIFSRYGITEADWDALRAAPDLAQDRAGREYLTPDAAERSPADLSDRDRTALGLKLRAYLVDSADRALITPTATDRNIARLGMSRDPNTVAGQVGRFVAQFHTWPVAMGRTGLGREWNGRTGLGSRIGGLLSLMGTATAAAYVGDTINGFIQGKEPAQITPDTVFNSFVRGGALGLGADYMAAGARDGAEGLAKAVAGPAATQQAMPLAQMIAKAWHAARTGDGKKLEAAMGHFAAQNVPLGNLFYLRGALHYLFLDSLQESLDPGYLERHNRYMQQHEGASYLSPHPTAHLHTFGR